jgi:hypothetical protein
MPLCRKQFRRNRDAPIETGSPMLPENLTAALSLRLMGCFRRAAACQVVGHLEKSILPTEDTESLISAFSALYGQVPTTPGQRIIGRWRCR